MYFFNNDINVLIITFLRQGTQISFLITYCVLVFTAFTPFFPTESDADTDTFHA